MATDSVARAIALAAKAGGGKPGPQGPKGDDGLAATIQIGTVTTGAAGTEAAVTNSGTENAAVFNFTIPKGDPGESGAGGIATITAGTGTSSEVFNKDATNTNAAASPYSHAEGFGSTTADMETAGVDNTGSHAEGYQTTAKGGGAHAEGWKTYAEGQGAHAQGYGTKAVGNGAFASGYSETPGNIVANGNNAYVIGYVRNDGKKIEAQKDASVIIGYVKDEASLTNNSTGALIFGYAEDKANISISPGASYSNYCVGGIAGGHCQGDGRIILGSNYGSGDGSVAYGTCRGIDQITGIARSYIISKGSGSFALGYSQSSTVNKTSYLQATKNGGFAMGSSRDGNITSSNEGAFAMGYSEKTTPITASGVGSIAIGAGSTATATGSIGLGFCTNSSIENQTVLGKYNIAQTSTDETKYGLIFGNGTADARANAYTLDWQGNATFAGTVTSASGADYAEYFEWKDGNKDAEDRVGYIVRLDGNKIVKAKKDDDILGIISGCATVIGDNAEWNWQGRFVRDEFGRIIYDQVEQFMDVPDPDWEPNPEKPEEKAPIIKKSLGYFPVPRENPDYNPEEKYTNRSNRPEWDTVGMMGKLYVRDDGTAAINDYVAVSDTTDGIATKAEGRTSMRVMERVNDHIIRVCFK